MEMISAEALAYDLHTHSTFSDGNNAPVHMAKVVSSYGMKGVIIADHIFSEKDADELLEKQRGVVFPETDCKFRFGAEIAMKDVDGTPAATPEQQKNFKFLLLDFNYVVFNKIAELNKSKEYNRDLICDLMLKACEYERIQVMAHPFNCGMEPLYLPLSAFDDARVEKIAAAFAANNKVFELMNTMMFWHRDGSYEEFEREYLRITRIFKAAGVRFSISSDAHTSSSVGNFRWAAAFAGKLGVLDELYIPKELFA